MAKKKNKRKVNVNRIAVKHINDYKKVLYSTKEPSTVQIRSILEHIKTSNTSSVECNQALTAMLTDQKFVSGLRTTLTSLDPDVVISPLSYLSHTTVDENLVWISSILNIFPDELRKLKKLSLQLEVALLRNDTKSFETATQEIESVCGTSLWLESCKLSMLYFNGEDEEVIRIRNNLPENINDLTRASLLNSIVTSRSSATLEGYLISLSRQSEDLKVNGFYHFDEYIKAVDYFDPAIKMNNPEVVSSLLGYAKLVDLFLYYKRLLKYCVLHHIPIHRALGACNNLNKELNDVELSQITFLLQGDLKRDKKLILGDIEHDVYKIFDLYLSCNYRDVLTEAEIVLSERPNLSIIYEIVARSQLITETKIKTTDLLTSILECIEYLICKVDVEANTKKLGKYFLNLKQFDWSYHLKAQIDKFDFKDTSSVSHQYNFSDMSFVKVNPFGITWLEEQTNSKKFKSAAVNYKTLINFVTYAVESTNYEENSLIPYWRFLKVEGDKYFKKKKHKEANSYYSKLLQISEEGYCREELKAKIIESNFMLCNYRVSVVALSKMLLDDNEPSVFPLKIIAEYVVENVEATDDIEFLEACAIVLFFYNIKCSESDVTQEISNVSEQLITILPEFDFNEVNFSRWNLSPTILTHILSVDVLDGFVRHFLDDDIDVFKTRIKLCQNLLEELDKEKDRALYIHLMNESQSAFNKMILYFCASDTSEGRLQVDKESLKVLLADSLSDEFEEICKIQDNGLPIEMIQLDDDEIATVTGSDYQMKVISLFVEIINEYTMNKLFGLDNSLNVGFRHGEIVDHLWMALKNYKLSGSRTEESSFNVESIFEDYKLFNQSTIKEYKKAYKDFLFEMNKAVKLFRNNCNVDAGELVYEKCRFYNYPIDSEWLHLFIDSHRKGANLSALIDIAFQILDEKTTKLTQIVKTESIDGLQSNVSNLYNKLLLDLEGAPIQLMRKISLSKNSFLEQITSMRDWFDWADEPKHPFVINAAAEMSKDIVSSLNQNIEFKRLTIEHDSYLLGSRFFTTFVNIFSLIYTNAVEHSGLDFIEVEELFTSDQSGISMKFTNMVESSKREKLLSKVDQINKKLEGDVVDWASKDKSSGIFKVKSMLDNKLKLPNKMSVASYKGNFSINVEIADMTNLKV